MAVFRALGELARMRIMRRLLRGRRSVNELAAALDMSPYNVSKHLRVLREAGLIAVEREGRFRYYAVAPGLRTHLAANRNVLALDCCTFNFDKLPR